MTTKLIAFATIKNAKSSWEEDFEVGSKESAEQDVRDVIEYFNSSLKPGESPREFIALVRIEEKEVVPQTFFPTPDDDWEEDDEYMDEDYY